MRHNRSPPDPGVVSSHSTNPDNHAFATRMKFKVEVICFAVLCITLSLGLWPFYSPPNSVSWANGYNGIVLGKYGTVLSSGALTPAESPKDAAGSIEIWLQPDKWSGSATLLSLYRPEKGLQFTLQQSLTRLNLNAEIEPKHARLEADEFFGPALRQKKPVFIAIASGPEGTRLYLDGTLAKVAPQFRIPDGIFTARLILGDSPGQPDSFRGQFRGLAIYDTCLSDSQVMTHYRSWTGDGQPAIAQEERNIALYLFNEKSGSTMHNRAGTGGDLYVPDKYTVVDKIALEPVWSEFDFSRSYWSGNLKNIVGFIPFGFCFYACFVIARPVRRAVLITLLMGTAASVTIEVFQIFLPMRDSGTTDIFTNTLGTYLGVLCYRNIYPAVVKRVPWLGWFAWPVEATVESPEAN